MPLLLMYKLLSKLDNYIWAGPTNACEPIHYSLAKLDCQYIAIKPISTIVGWTK